MLFFSGNIMFDSDFMQAVVACINPHLVFLEFMEAIGYDDSLLLEYLISSETDFLEYFAR